MAYNPVLEAAIDDLLSEDLPDKKRMFGGICYLVNGNMCFGIWKDFLIVRMAPELAAEKLARRHAREFDITGRPMKGWVMVEEKSWRKNKDLASWVSIGISFARSLPEKKTKRKSIEEVFYRSGKLNNTK